MTSDGLPLSQSRPVRTLSSVTRLSIALLLGLACGDGSPATVDAPAIDAPPPHPIVGRWERDLYNPGPAPVVVFEADGTYRYNTDVGTWSITGDQLVTERTQSPKQTALYYLSNDRDTMMMQAMRPTTPTIGLVGTWVGDFTYSDGVHSEYTMEFREDNTMTWANSINGNPPLRIDQGTWRLDDNSIFIEAMLGTTPVSVGMKLVPDVVIGDGLLRRLE
jgi:hypothetical protein